MAKNLVKNIVADGVYRVACHGCNAVCRTSPHDQTAGVRSLWFCKCNHPEHPDWALLLCDECIVTHICPEK